MLGMDTRSLLIGVALGFFVAPIALGKARALVGK